MRIQRTWGDGHVVLGRQRLEGDSVCVALDELADNAAFLVSGDGGGVGGAARVALAGPLAIGLASATAAATTHREGAERTELRAHEIGKRCAEPRPLP